MGTVRSLRHLPGGVRVGMQRAPRAGDRGAPVGVRRGRAARVAGARSDGSHRGGRGGAHRAGALGVAYRRREPPGGDRGVRVRRCMPRALRARTRRRSEAVTDLATTRSSRTVPPMRSGARRRRRGLRLPSAARAGMPPPRALAQIRGRAPRTACGRVGRRSAWRGRARPRVSAVPPRPRSGALRRRPRRRPEGCPSGARRVRGRGGTLRGSARGRATDEPGDRGAERLPRIASADPQRRARPWGSRGRARVPLERRFGGPSLGPVVGHVEEATFRLTLVVPADRASRAPSSLTPPRSRPEHGLLGSEVGTSGLPR